MRRFSNGAGQDETQNKNTSYSTSTWYNVYRTWAENNGARVNLQTYDKSELNAVLERFFAEVQKKDGGEYEPTSLAVMQAALDRHLHARGCGFSILRDREFESSRLVLDGKARELKKQGRGKRPHATHSLTWPEEDILWQCGQLGDSSPRALQNTIYFLLGQHFGFRGRQEHYNLRIEDFAYGADENGIRFLRYKEDLSRNRHRKSRSLEPKMYATTGQRCILTLFEKFVTHRPECYKKAGPFYLALIDAPATDVWYKETPLGIHSINDIMKYMINNSPLSSDRPARILANSFRTIAPAGFKQIVVKEEIIAKDSPTSSTNSNNGRNNVEQKMMSDRLISELNERKERQAQRHIEDLKSELTEKEKEVEDLRHALRVKSDELYCERVASSGEVASLTLQIEKLEKSTNLKQNNLLRQIQILKQENELLKTTQDQIRRPLIGQDSYMGLQEGNPLQLLSGNDMQTLPVENNQKQYVENNTTFFGNQKFLYGRGEDYCVLPCGSSVASSSF